MLKELFSKMVTGYRDQNPDLPESMIVDQAKLRVVGTVRVRTQNEVGVTPGVEKMVILEAKIKNRIVPPLTLD